jgi:LPS sulfotransferase NodH
MSTKVDLIRSRSLAELNCSTVLSRRDNWTLVCDEPFHAHFVGEGIPLNRLRLLAALPASHHELTGNVYVICTNADEAPHTSLIKGRGGQAIGLFTNVIPRLIALAPPRFNPPPAAQSTKNYALISLPRSGSTVLGRELRVLGIGLPTEHIRDPVIEFARHRAVTNFDMFNWWKFLTQSQTKNNVFGTKIIWHFLQMFQERLATAEYDWLIEQLSTFSFFHLLRSDKVAQAVSDYVAHATGVWHKWRDKSDQYEEKLTRIADASVDMTRLLATYHNFCASEDALRRFLEGIGAPVTEIRFDQICENPRREAAKIGRALGFDISAEAALAPPSLDRTTSTQHLKIEEELRAHLVKAA